MTLDRGSHAWGIGAALLGAWVSMAHAHHSNTAFDAAQSVDWRVAVTEFRFVNPHAYVYFTMADKAGRTVAGRCELRARTALARMGWSVDTLRAGEAITIRGAPARNEANVCLVNSIVRANGTEIGTHQPAAQPAAAVPERPGFAGYWVSQGRGAGGGPPGVGPPGREGPPRGSPPGAAGPPGGRPQPTAAGIAAARGYEQPHDDPALQCDIANIIFGWTHDQNVNEIRQQGNTITLRYGYMDFVRTIHMGLRGHPDNLPPTRGGHSIGRWEGDTLVVDTVGLAAGVLVPIRGVMFSSQAHVVERFTLDAAAKTLTRTYTFEDPLYLQQPHAGRDVMVASREPYTPYDCVELSGDNNRRPPAK